MKKSIYSVLVFTGALIFLILLNRPAKRESIPKKETQIEFSDNEVVGHKIKMVNGVAEVVLDSQDQGGPVNEMNK
ncbi:MAG: hypothetical protein H7Z71_02670 [Moraxellaceae bacterium]|nr:hypothetical protein [Pseudobdellovibrionaceae bacterium]